MSCGSELDGIGNKVVDDLLYSIDIAFDYCIDTYELMLKEKPFIIDRLCGTPSTTRLNKSDIRNGTGCIVSFA